MTALESAENEEIATALAVLLSIVIDRYVPNSLQQANIIGHAYTHQKYARSKLE